MNPADRTLIEQNALFNGMDNGSFDYMLEHSVMRGLAAGERLLQPDIENRHLHLILESSLNVYLIAQESQEHTSLKAGECVGEVSLIDGKFPSAIGITPTQHDDRLESLIHEADQALYRAKQNGRNRVEVFH